MVSGMVNNVDKFLQGLTLTVCQLTILPEVLLTDMQYTDWEILMHFGGHPTSKVRVNVHGFINKLFQLPEEI